MKPIKSTSNMQPVGKLGFRDVRLLVTTVARVEKDVIKLADVVVLSKPFSVGYTWDVIERTLEHLAEVTINDEGGAGWVGTSLYKGIPK
ncbi:hypothetical protein KKF82_05025 [Patescibacteria group bacterium]|nr:hypothetical protein [Patescibacteria group bacterium]